MFTNPQTMLRLLLLWVLTALAVLGGAYLLPWAEVDGFGTALIVAIILGLINLTVRPILLFLTLPLNILTLGLFTFVINALMILLADALVSGFEAGNFLTALIISLFVSLASIVVSDLKDS